MGGKLKKNRHNKRNGCVYEQIFFARAMKKGFEVFVPTGDHLPQDCHIVNESGKIYRVQIKGTSTAANEPGKKYPRYRITSSRSNARAQIECEDVDIVACYIEPHDIFYIVPCELITGVSTWFYCNDPRSKHELERYRENWEVFKAA